jgi:hypothetical protein
VGQPSEGCVRCDAHSSDITGSHSAKVGFRYHNNDSTFPKNYYNNSQLKCFFQNGVPSYGTTYLNPLSITAARFFKIGVQFDF